MYEKELLEKQKKIGQIVKDFAVNPEEAIEKLETLQKEVNEFASEASPEYYGVAAAICEAKGDVYLKAKKAPEAEKSFQEMVRISTKLYECNKEKYDYRLGAANYKLGTFYRSIIGCNLLSPRPKQLNEPQKKVFDVADKCYKNAIGYTMANAKKGDARYAQLHAVCMGDLLVLHSAVGNYANAELFGKDAVRLNKAIYQRFDDKAHALCLANQMNGLAAVYTFMKNPSLAAQMLEDAIFVLEEHEAEDPLTFRAMLGRFHISLASCYSAVEEEKENAEATYKKGLNIMVEINKQANNRLINDVIQSYIFVGDYYKKVNKESEAKAHYIWAMKQASDMLKQTKNPMYEAILKRLRAKV